MLLHISTLSPWRGERLGGKALPPNIEELWSNEELNKIGLARVVPAGDTPPPTNLHKLVGVTRSFVGGEVVETPTFALPDRGEFIGLLASRAWALFGEKFFIKDTLSDWTGYRAELKTRGLAILAAFDAGGHDIDVAAGSIDGKGAWPE